MWRFSDVAVSVTVTFFVNVSENKNGTSDDDCNVTVNINITSRKRHIKVRITVKIKALHLEEREVLCFTMQCFFYLWRVTLSKIYFRFSPYFHQVFNFSGKEHFYVSKMNIKIN